MAITGRCREGRPCWTVGTQLACFECCGELSSGTTVTCIPIFARAFVAACKRMFRGPKAPYGQASSIHTNLWPFAHPLSRRW